MVDASEVRATLGLADDARSWYDTWEAVDVSDVDDDVFPGAARLEELLVDRLSVDPVDARAAAEARPDPRRHPQLWWVMRRCYRQLVDDMGGTGMIMWPKLDASFGAPGRFAYLYALVAALPHTLRYHRDRGVPEDVTWATLGNVGEKLRLNRARFGEPGLSVAFWFTLHFRGVLYQLGRLEFALERLGGDHPFPGREAGELTLGVHIPADGGPLTPRACAESLSRVDDFFAKHFADRFPTAPVLTCSSWLLDPRLRERLPEGSNIAAFGELFELAPPTASAETDGERDVLLFVFDHVGGYDPAELPRDSRLRTVLADGFADGTRWQVRSGIVRRPFPVP